MPSRGEPAGGPPGGGRGTTFRRQNGKPPRIRSRARSLVAILARTSAFASRGGQRRPWVATRKPRRIRRERGTRRGGRRHSRWPHTSCRLLPRVGRRRRRRTAGKARRCGRGPGGPRRSGGGRCEPTAPGAGARGDGSLRPDSRSRGPGFPPPPAEARGVKTEELPPWGVRQSPAASLRITPWLSIVSFPIVMRERRSRLKRILEEDAAPGHTPLSPRAGSVFHGHLPGTGLWGGAPRGGGGTRLGSRPPHHAPQAGAPRGLEA